MSGDRSTDSVFEVLAERIDCVSGPFDVRVLSGIEVEFVKHIGAARIDCGDAESDGGQHGERGAEGETRQNNKIKPLLRQPMGI